MRGLYLIHGKILADQGDAPGAEAAFKKEIELFPDNVRGYSSLAILYALTGRNSEVGAMLQNLTTTNSSPQAYAEAVKTLRILNDPRSATSLLRYAMGKFPSSPELTKLAQGG